MRVFSVEMLVKEEGAAVVEAALKRLKNEAKAVAAQMKVTTSNVTNTGKAMKEAGDKTEIAKDRAAKAAIGFAAVGQSIARTGTLTADAGTRIIEAGSQIATMFGPKGLVVAAMLATVTAIINMSDEGKKRLKELREAADKELTQMADNVQLTEAVEKMRGLQFGVPSGAIDDILDLKDGFKALNDEIRRRENLPVAEFMAPGQREELRRLRAEAAEAIRQYRDLERMVLNARVAARPTRAPSAITITATAPQSREAANREREQELAAFKAFNEQYARESEAAFAYQMDLAEQERTAMLAFDAQFYKDSMDAFAFQMDRQATLIRERLSTQIAGSIRDGFRSGLEAALATGDIRSFTQALAQTLNSTLSKSLTTFIASGFEDMFKSIGKRLLKGLANMMADFAAKSIVFGKMMEAIKSFLSFGNGLGAVLAATALLAFANANGGKASMGSRTVAGGTEGLMSGISGTMPTSQIIFGATSATTAAGMQPRSATNVTIIGPNDPSAQRAMQELLAKANSRGRVG
jgi:hypothetical protein